MNSPVIALPCQHSGGNDYLQGTSILPAEPSAGSTSGFDRQYHHSVLSELDGRYQIPLARPASSRDHPVAPGQVHHPSSHPPSEDGQCRNWQTAMSSINLPVTTRQVSMTKREKREKQGGHRGKPTTTFDPRGEVFSVHWVFMTVILRSFGAFAIFSNFVKDDRKVKGIQIGPQE